jgi:hypothetical protein
MSRISQLFTRIGADHMKMSTAGWREVLVMDKLVFYLSCTVGSATVFDGRGTRNIYTYLWALVINLTVMKSVLVMLMHSKKGPQDFCDHFKCKQTFNVNFKNIKASVWQCCIPCFSAIL